MGSDDLVFIEPPLSPIVHLTTAFALDMSNKDAPLPEGDKKHDNSQKVGPPLSKFGFYSKAVASEFDISDEDISFVERYDGDPIEPVTSEGLLKEDEIQCEYDSNEADGW